MKYAPQLLDRLRENWVLAIMLLVLHGALHSDLGSALSRSLMTAHLGLFFLWQPIWQRDQRLDLSSVIVIVLFTAVFVATLGWWMVFGWLLLLIGIVAGRSFFTRQERYIYMLTLAFLVTELLLECVPSLFRVGSADAGIARFSKIGLTVVPLLIFGMAGGVTAPRQTFAVDFFRGITFALMTALLAIGSVLITLDSGTDYPVALVVSLIALGAFLLMISWLISPGTDGGLGSLWEQSLLNIGTPFEAWLASLADQADEQHTPESFLLAAMTELVELPWISGVVWKTPRFEGKVGGTARNPTVLKTRELTVSLYTERRVGPALLLHCRLLIAVLGHFFAAKTRETEHAQQAHMQAIYETGARLTHDIKNLLQSLKTVTSALERSSEEQDEERTRKGQELLKRQLPEITRRLELALEKLQAPVQDSQAHCSLSTWWQQLCDRYGGHNIEFHTTIDGARRDVPRDCFDSVLENLLDNALNKSRLENGLRIRVELTARGDGVAVSVADDGQAIAPATAAQLFKQPLSSDHGLGVGLYHAARQAAAAGYFMRLAANRDGEVRIEVAVDRRSSVAGR